MRVALSDPALVTAFVDTLKEEFSEGWVGAFVIWRNAAPNIQRFVDSGTHVSDIGWVNSLACRWRLVLAML